MVSTMASVEQVKIPEGYKQTDIGVIPEDWEEKQVQDVCGFIVPGRNKPIKFDGNIPWITTPDLTDGRVVYSSFSELKISEKEAKSVGSRVVPAGSVIMSCVGELGIVAIAGCDMVLNQQLHAFIPSGKINAYYLAYALKTQEKYFYSAATKTALPYLNKDNCNATPIVLPTLSEQTTIANALSDVDSLIASLETLIAKKSAIKTAAMQQLLTGKKRLPGFEKLGTNQGEKQDCDHLADNNSTNEATQINASLTKNTGQTTPRPGYKQTELGEIPEDWEVISIGHALEAKIILDQMDGNHGELYPKSHEFSDFGIPYVGATDFDNGKVNFSACKYLPLKRAKTFKKGIAKNGDVLFAHNATVGPVALLEDKFDFVILSTTATYYRCDHSQINNKYLASYFESQLFVNQYTSVMSQSTRNQVPILTQRKFKLVLPELEEQTAIANVLSDMDTELDALQQRLSKTKKIKQGMMQELLTGKTRLLNVS